MLPLLLALLVVLGIWVCLKWSSVKGYWKVRDIPHDAPHFIWGSLTFLQKKNPAIWMREIYEKFKAPYVGIWLFWRPALVINCPKISHRILVKDFDVFRNRHLGTGIADVDPLGGLNIFTVNDPTWSTIRKRLTSIFTSAKLNRLHGLYSSKSKELMKRIDNDLRNDNSMELRSMFADYTTDIIGITAFGVGSDATLTGDSAIRSITKDFMKFSTYRGLGWCSIFFFPELVNIFRFHFYPKKSENYFKEVYKQIVKQRGGYCKVEKESDLLDILRTIKSEAIEEGTDMDENLLISQAAIILFAGFDTSASALTFSTYELAHHPEVQEKLYKELIEVKESLGDKELDGTVLRNLVYLNCVIKETLRKYSPMGWLDRIASRDYKIDENLTIPAGTPLYVNAIGMHYDPQYYPEPTEYRPERFLPENENANVPFMPFGDGPRNCIGMRFAYHTVWYALSSLVLNYKVETLPNAKKPSDCEIEKRGLLITPGEPFHVKFIPRN